jgi:hypothetical protein
MACNQIVGDHVLCNCSEVSHLRAESVSAKGIASAPGCGFDTCRPGGHGLRNMADRARALGGSISEQTVNEPPLQGLREVGRI